jgi:hypothetical protein
MILIIPDAHLNSMQVETIYRLIQATKYGASFINVVARVDGVNRMWEADWIKHMRVAEGPIPAPDETTIGYAAGYKDGYALGRGMAQNNKGEGR